MKLKLSIYSSAFLCFMSIVILSCKKEEKTNEKLFDETSASDLRFYQNKDSILSPAGSSPHGSFKLKFNSIAVNQFGADGKLPAGGEFKDGSLIVKEVYTGGVLSLYAMMKKDSKSKFAGNGWLWAEYKPDGETVFSAGKKGDGCISCHSSGTHRDLTLSFDLH